MAKRVWYTNKYHKEMLSSRAHAPGPFPMVLILDHLKASYNVGKILRTANIFGCREVHLINIPMFDPNPAKGALKHTRTRSFATFEESYKSLLGEGYQIYALDPRGEEPVNETQFPEKVAFVLGHEEYGFSFDPRDFPELKYLKIPQFGIVQSLNVSIAGSLACYEYLRQKNFEAPAGYEMPKSRGTTSHTKRLRANKPKVTLDFEA